MVNSSEKSLAFSKDGQLRARVQRFGGRAGPVKGAGTGWPRGGVT